MFSRLDFGRMGHVDSPEALSTHITHLTSHIVT